MSALTEAQARVLRRSRHYIGPMHGISPNDYEILFDLERAGFLQEKQHHLEITPAGREALAEYADELYRLGGLTIESVERGEADFAAGRTTPWEEVKREMKE